MNACTHTRKTSTFTHRIAAHKAMARAALHADSSLATRLKRYNHHMEHARSLELQINIAPLPSNGGAI